MQSLSWGGHSPGSNALYGQRGSQVAGRRLVSQTKAPYGSWKCPITSELIVSGTIGLSDVVVSDDNIYWIESRPSERGRRSIQRWSPDGAISRIDAA